MEDEKYSGGFWDQAAEIVDMVESELKTTFNTATYERLQEAIYNKIKYNKEVNGSI